MRLLAGIMVVYATPNVPIAGVVSGLFFGIWNLFTGFLIGHQVSKIIRLPAVPQESEKLLIGSNNTE